jgi:hypothetical protein
MDRQYVGIDFHRRRSVIVPARRPRPGRWTLRAIASTCGAAMWGSHRPRA